MSNFFVGKCYLFNQTRSKYLLVKNSADGIGRHDMILGEKGQDQNLFEKWEIKGTSNDFIISSVDLNVNVSWIYSSPNARAVAAEDIPYITPTIHMLAEDKDDGIAIGYVGGPSYLGGLDGYDIDYAWFVLGQSDIWQIMPIM